MERHAQQALLGAQADAAGEVEERGRQEAAVAEDAHGARLLDDEQTVGVEGRRGDLHRLREAGCDADGGEVRGGVRGDAGAQRRRVLELTGVRAAVAAHHVAVVALLGRERGAVAALRGRGAGRGRQRQRDQGATEVRCQGV